MDRETKHSEHANTGGIAGSGSSGEQRAGREAIPAHGGRRAAAARRYGIPKEELLDFSASINLLGPSRDALSAIKGAAVELAHYPDETPADLLSAVSGHLGVFPDEIVLGNGSIEVIYWLAAVLKPRRVLIVEPTFSEYRRACEGAGAECDSFTLSEEDGFAFNTNDLDPTGYDAVFLCNPNNPTGYLAPVEEIAALKRRCLAAGAALVVDEAFIDFAGHEESIISYGVSRQLYVVRSFTKSHALAGLRLGCLVASADFAARMQRRMPPWNVNAFAMAAGKASLNDWQFMTRSFKENLHARRLLFEDLNALDGITPLPSEANFLLCRLEGIGSAELAERLASQGIIVRDCRSFAGLGDRYIRIAVRSERDNYQLVSSLRKAL